MEKMTRRDLFNRAVGGAAGVAIGGVAGAVDEARKNRKREDRHNESVDQVNIDTIDGEREFNQRLLKDVVADLEKGNTEEALKILKRAIRFNEEHYSKK